MRQTNERTQSRRNRLLHDGRSHARRVAGRRSVLAPRRVLLARAGGVRPRTARNGHRSFGKHWLFTIAEESWRPAAASTSPHRPARRCPRRTVHRTLHGGPVSARLQPAAEAVGAGHRHPGPEAWYVLSGAQCLETPNGIIMVSAGGTAMVPEGWPMAISDLGTEIRRTVLLVLHPSSEPYMPIEDPGNPGAPHSHWRPRGLCPQ